MRSIKYILFFIFCTCINIYAQTPYDSFSPATSRPILDVVQDMDTYKDSLQSSPMDTTLVTQDDVSKWLSPDPLGDKYPEISPYAYCNWNPVKYIDPDGRIAIAVKPNAQNRLLSTLSCLERKYVSFDNDGKINEELLNQCQSTSHNMTALKALANSKEVTYNFLVQNASTTGETSGESMVIAGGVTEMYGMIKDASPDPSIVNIISGSHLTGKAAATNMAHEAFGHAYMYELTGGDTNKASHDYKPDVNNSYIGSDGTIDLLYIDTNADLQQHIQAAIKEVKNNFDCGL